MEVEHARGVTRVPADAQRIVVLDTDKLDSLCALGLQGKIVGAATGADQIAPSYLGRTIRAVPSVGPFQTPNLEQIAGLEPDLIIGTNFRQEQFYDQLNAIAPTVFTATVGKTWKENVLLDGKAVARGGAAAKLMDEYRSTTSQLRARVDPARTLSVTRFMGEDLRIYGPDSFVGQVLADSGVTRPEPQQLNGAADRRFAKVSTEDLSITDGAMMAVCAYGQSGRDRAAEVMKSPLWGNQSAVKSGNAWAVSDAVWMTGIGVVGARGVLTDLDVMVT
ncbi:MAG: iron-siderophore ABC transporter substrate-binding protein [Propionibacteriales bacterium]|nr:iron-siderophore ABC transporter substrate-binding protein [Propionibacteriales bacterium]